MRLKQPFSCCLHFSFKEKLMRKILLRRRRPIQRYVQQANAESDNTIEHLRHETTTVVNLLGSGTAKMAALTQAGSFIN